MKKEDNQGFTLIEILVVVLIIGVLSAVAVPQYQKAVLKSRFASLLPSTQAVRDGQEAYYLTNGQYARNLSDLDISLTTNEETIVTLSQHSDYKYAKATKDSIRGQNNLIMYQKQSPNFSGEIHCEAKQGDAQAEWLCKESLHATQELGTIVTPGFNTYVLEGSGDGMSLPSGVLINNYNKEIIKVTKAVKNALGIGPRAARDYVREACEANATTCVIGGELTREQQKSLLDEIVNQGLLAELGSGSVESEDEDN